MVPGVLNKVEVIIFVLFVVLQEVPRPLCLLEVQGRSLLPAWGGVRAASLHEIVEVAVRAEPLPDVVWAPLKHATHSSDH